MIKRKGMVNEEGILNGLWEGVMVDTTYILTIKLIVG